MRDNIERDCCSTIEKTLTKNLKGWEVEKRKFHDPGMTLVLKGDSWGLPGNTRITVKISWGKEL